MSDGQKDESLSQMAGNSSAENFGGGSEKHFLNLGGKHRRETPIEKSPIVATTARRKKNWLLSFRFVSFRLVGKEEAEKENV